ncbi:multicopper oxidase family protein [Saezia sanguinis]|uniref:multicopper oxidase family protein n=1 Tax=Saezia sanguinis TaxID=1965230 RepID=UPI0030DCB3DD
MLKKIQRRQFLQKQLTLGAGALLPGWVYAQMRPGMAHNGGHTMMNNLNHQMPMHASALAPVDAITAHQSLRPLWRLPNMSRQAGVYRARMVAKPQAMELVQGQQTQFWCYEDHVPGPLIELNEGDRVEIEFINQLPQPTTIHWHGLPVPADQDGAPMDLIAPGEQKIYQYTLPTDCAGTYWFHPHPHHMTAEQVYRGLAGAVIVRSGNDPLAALPEQHLIISDLKLGGDGQIVPNDMMDWMNGREGQFALVNGQRQPVIELAEPQRWRLWNMCSARYLRLSLGNVPLTLVGTDGGLLQTPQTVSELLLAPGERAELVVTPAAFTKTADVVLAAEPYERGKMSMGSMHAPAEQRIVLAQVHVTPYDKTYALPTALRSISVLGPAQVTRTFEFTEKMDMRRMHAGLTPDGRVQGMDFLINGRLYDPQRIDFEMQRDTVELWKVTNSSDMDHPFHVHGTQFQVIARQMKGQEETAEPFLAWRDTVNVRAGETVQLKTMQHLPGERMYHCHILEHEDLGMMGTLRVV